MIKFIAEIGSNHNNDWNRTELLIKAAKHAGCYAVKFQYYKAEKLWHPSLKNNIESAMKSELPKKFLPKISKLCKELGIKFICSVFDLENISLVSKHVDYLKIASYEFLWIDLFKECLDSRLPVMISTGLCNEDEILEFGEELLSYDFYENQTLTIFHCVANYPARAEECNLAVLPEFHKMFFPHNIGWSDHTTEPGVIHKAVELGAEYIELHFDIQLPVKTSQNHYAPYSEYEAGNESVYGHCWNSEAVRTLIKNINIGEHAIGKPDKKPVGDEINNRKFRADPVDGLRLLRRYR